MAEVLRSGFANRFVYGGELSRFRAAGFVLALGSCFFAQSLGSSAQSASPARDAKKTAQSASKPPAAESVDAAPAPAPIALPPTQTPFHAPVISWDGNRLTIDAENSSLGEILLGIRSRTGASIEMPGSTNAERIAVHLGPAPIRDVLSSLLYGTDFNYVIQASEDDESGLGKVILSSRSGDQGDDTIAGDSGADPKIRLMPGYAAPGKRDFEVAHSNAAADSSSIAETPGAPESAPNQDAASVAAATDSTSTPTSDSQPVASTSESADSNSSPDTMLTASEQPVSGNSAPTGLGGSGTASAVGGTPTISQMEQNLQRMYQQRQQLQAHQNQPAQTPAP